LYRILAKHGYRVLVAAYGIEALAVARAYNGPIHLLRTDVDMPPGIDGLELARLFNAEWPETKVLLVTGNSTPENGFLRKPFTEEELIAKVHEVLKSPPLEKAAENGE
jgi:two-component system cell cycle sensor histidine kinase/response regulator CckA